MSRPERSRWSASWLERLERHVPLTTGIAFALPTVIAHYPPMSDLPLHESVVGIMRHYGDASWFPPDLYELNLGHTNQLFYYFAFVLSYLVGSTWAVKIVVAAMQVLIFVTGARLADHLGRSRWSAVLLAPLALGFTYYWGLVTNLAGFVVLLGALPVFDRASVRPDARGLGGVLGALFLLYLAHESALLIALGFLAVLVVARPLDLRATALRVLPIVASAGFAIAHFVWSRKFLTGGQIVLPPDFPSPWEKVKALPADLFGSHDTPTRVLLFALGVLAMLSLLVARIRSEGTDAPSTEAASTGSGRVLRLQALLLRYRFEAFAFALLLTAAVSPDRYQGATLLHQRFLAPAWALFAITAAPRGAPSRLAKIATASVPIGMALLSWPQFLDSDQTYRHLDELMGRLPMNSSVAMAVVDCPLYRTRVYSAGTGPARSVVLRGGRSAVGLYTSPISPVQIRREYRWDELDVRMILSGSMTLMPARDLMRFEWVIAESRDPRVREALIVAFQPDADYVATSGEWMLFHSTHPQRPLTSPDMPPSAVKDTIFDRVSYMVRRSEHPPPPGVFVPIPWQVGSPRPTP